MIRRSIAALLALGATLAAMILYVDIMQAASGFEYVEYLRCVLSLGLVGFAVFAFRRTRSWTAILLLIGASCAVLVKMHDAVIFYMLSHGLIPQTSWFWPTCTENPLLLKASLYLMLISLCAPLVTFPYVYRRATDHLTNRSSQRPTGACNSFR